MSGAGGPISGPCAAGAKPRTGPESSPARPARARSGPQGFTNEDAGKPNGFSNRGAFQSIGPSPHETLNPDLAARAVGLELKGPPGDGPDDVNKPSDPTTAGDEGRRRSRGRARGWGQGEG
jgi:hypothetical protein